MSGGGVRRARTCVGCGKQADKVELLRIVRTPDGQVAFDATGRVSGRGAYVCSVECLGAACKARKLQRALKCNVGEEAAVEIVRQIAEANAAAIDDRRV